MSITSSNSLSNLNFSSSFSDCKSTISQGISISLASLVESIFLISESIILLHKLLSSSLSSESVLGFEIILVLSFWFWDINAGLFSSAEDI